MCRINSVVKNGIPPVPPTTSLLMERFRDFTGLCQVFLGPKQILNFVNFSGKLALLRCGWWWFVLVYHHMWGIVYSVLASFGDIITICIVICGLLACFG